MKIEISNSLYQVMFYKGEYSDYTEETIIFAGNNKEEIINSIKIYIHNSIKEENDDIFNYSSAIKFNNELYVYKKDEASFDITLQKYIPYGYSIIYLTIEQLGVVYTGLEIAPNNINKDLGYKK